MADFLTNESDEIYAALGTALSQANRADWAVAFVRKSVVDRLSDALESFTRRGGLLRLVVGEGLGITQAEALELLSILPGVQIRVYHHPRVSFHAKLYLFANDEQRALVGSANLSFGALSSNVETAVRLSPPDDSEAVSRAADWFERLWNSDRCLVLTPTLINAIRLRERVEVSPDFENVFESERVLQTTSVTVRERGASYDTVGIAGAERWLLITSPQNYEVCVSRRVWGDGSHSRISRLRRGDFVIFYVTGTFATARLASLARVVSEARRAPEAYWASTDPRGERYTYCVDLDFVDVPALPRAAGPLAISDQLDLFAGATRSNWGARVQGFMRPLSLHDAIVILSPH
jgi:HKD family nuclease